ncbi:hypothetical protein [Marinomonas ostreistagni]|uniref:hypothetical protein n=1 Tax=Marinomonas ostreistagni TaxID=359209 RepID=UPI00194FAF2C|nr:hypothetical protein [Marinomonas ostreistagni]MBM6551247.1 hypothetical protein [Marinomonas ostreistagni]
MPSVSASTLAQVSNSFYRLEGALYLASSKPLKAMLEMSEALALIRQHWPQESYGAEDWIKLDDVLVQCVAQEAFLPSACHRSLLAWFSEARSQFLAQYAFYLTPDWRAYERLKEGFWQSYQGMMTAQDYDYVGTCHAPIQQAFDELLSMQDLGFWQIQTGLHPIYRAEQPQAPSLTIRLHSALSLEQLGERFKAWHWQLMPSSEASAEVLPNKSCFEAIQWLHWLAAERHMWRKNATLVQLYKSLHEHVSSHYSQNLGKRTQGALGAGLEVGYDDLPSAQQAVFIELYWGRVCSFDESYQCLHRMIATNTSLPVYRLTFDEQQIVIPAYRVEPGSVVEQAHTWLRYGAEGWYEIPPVSVNDTSAVLVRALGKLFALLPDDKVRDYGVVLPASVLPPAYNNCWRLRSDDLFEPGLPGELAYIPKPTVTFAAPHGDLSCVALHLNAAQDLVVFNQWVMAIVPVNQVTWLTSGLLYIHGAVVPWLTTAERMSANDVMVILGNGDEAYFALHAERLKVHASAPEGLVNCDPIVLDWIDNHIRVGLTGPGQVLLDHQAMDACYQQLLEIFI